jgi:uroporphyrinogen decarboxylase
MTTHERMTRIYQHQEADHVPITDGPWAPTILRWRREGMPAEVNFVEYFGWDDIVPIWVDTSPRFERKIIEETEGYLIERDAWGITKKNFKPMSSTPQDLDFAIKDPESWQAAKERLTPTRDRINWGQLEQNYSRWRQEGAWIVAPPWFGYDIVNSRMCGTECVLIAMAEQPEWVTDMLDTLCDLALALLEQVWEAGYHFDELMWCDDMGYRNGLLFSKAMWRRMVRPYQERTIKWARRRGVKAHMHSCGNISPLLPELVELGLDALDPLEIKAGMDPIQIKREFGKGLVLRGGFDVRLWTDLPKAEADIRSKLPVLMESGGYIFSSDHSIPDNVSLENYRRIVEVVQEVGRY